MLLTRTFTLILSIWAIIYISGGLIGVISTFFEVRLVPIAFGIANLLHAVPVVGTIILINHPPVRTRTLLSICIIGALALFLLSFTPVILNDGVMNQVWQLTLALIVAYSVMQWAKSTNSQMN